MPLEGETIRLRAVERSDAARAYAWINDREVTEHLAVRYPLSFATEEEWVARAAQQNGYGDAVFAIEIADGGEHIGNCGLHNVSPEDRVAELGVMIGAKEHWGRGYGADAVRTLCRFGFEELDLHRIELTTADYNVRAQRYYERVGFVVEARKREHRYKAGRYHDSVIMVLLRSDFEAREAQR